MLNGKTVIPGATIPTSPRGRLALQHHGGKNKQGEWTGPPSLVQFKNIYIKELPPAAAGSASSRTDAVKALLITGGHDHEASFYTLFEGYPSWPACRSPSSPTAFQNDLAGKYDVVIMYDFTRDLDETGQKNLRDFVESGKGVVVLHHALLNYQKWPWWYQEVVGGSYRLQRDGRRPLVDRQGRPGDVRHARRCAPDHRGHRPVPHRGRNLQAHVDLAPGSRRC